MPDAIRVLVADDHPIVREGLRALLSRESDITVIGEAMSLKDTLAAVEAHAPQVVVLDIKLGDDDGIEACRLIKDSGSDARVVMLSAFWDETLVRRALHAGADGYLLKHVERFSIATSIRAAARGESVLDPSLMATVFGHLRRGGFDPDKPVLTNQELAILQLVAGGLTNRAIGMRLHLSHHTVKEHLSEIMGKLGAKNRAEAILMAIKRGLLEL